jgi:hypothetical protein
MPATVEHVRARPRPVRARRSHRVAVAVAVAVLSAGCVSSASPVAEAPELPTAAAPDDASTAGAGEADTGDCSDDLAALDAVITEQLAAFAADDWDAAWALTSRQFRAAGVDAEGLREIVTSGYPEAADAADHEVLGCALAGDDAQVLIEVTSTDGETAGLVYLMTREEAGWRVSGAVAHATGASEPPTIET